MSAKTIAEQFLKLNDLYESTDNIYAEITSPLVPFLPDNLYAVGKGFDYKKHMENSHLEFWHCVDYFVKSEIPNCFFTIPWDEFFDSKEQFSVWFKKNGNTAFAREYNESCDRFSFIYRKPYWEYFVIILACRGAKYVLDVAKPILNMFVDANRLGFFPLQCLVANNVQLFKTAIIDCMQVAIKEKEDSWLEYLKVLLFLGNINYEDIC